MAFDEGKHPLYPYTEEEKLEIRKQLGMKETTIQDDIDAIMDWFKKQPQLVDAGITRAMVERILIIAKGSLEKTKQRIDALYKHRSLAPELIQNRERELSPLSGDLWSFYRQAAMPKLYKGHRISVIKIDNPDPNSFFVDALFRNTFMLGDIRLQHDYMLGEIWVIDIQHAVIGHLLRLNPIIMHKTAQIFQEGLGLRVTAMHVLNCPSYGQTLMNVMKQFFKPKLLDRTIFHKSLEDLHEYIPKQYLPLDYGGDEPSLKEFKEMYEKEFKTERTKRFLVQCSKLISNESKRPGQIYEEQMTGSFKKLDLD
ncbi:unnamed protein product [Chilo suppressalis]|uniref:CRAL-TRIO domain-containing protein n=1 Tax=Chilo suppressalis TaxID=168631 RepID=A0ABN8B9A0_CHISP|nr:unnamed protein product [Chilo suppressalis]